MKINKFHVRKKFNKIQNGNNFIYSISRKLSLNFMHPNKLVTSKYTKATFFPLNLFHQLTKAPNIFFLITLILLSIPIISPFTPYTYLIAFLLVLGVSMLKDGIEDYQRHLSDDEYNKRITNVIIYNEVSNRLEVIKKRIEEIDKSDFVIVKCDEEIPGDMIFLTSKSFRKDGGGRCHQHCFVETSNLDGELNYKKKMAHSYLPKGTCTFQILDDNFKLCICDKNLIIKIKDSEVFDTGDALSDFECKLNVENKNLMQHEKNILLRGSRLKNTDQIFGVIVSVGDETKLSKSSKNTKQKISVFQRKLFFNIFFVMGLYFVILVSSSIFSSLFLTKDNIQYLYLTNYPAKDAFISTGTGFILYNYLIPISLFVTLEFARFFQGLFLENDRKMVRDNIKPQCRNTNITEDLGLIEYILADKTGTITKNAMSLKYLHSKNTAEIVDCESFFKRTLEVVKNTEKFKKLIEKTNPKDQEFIELIIMLNLLCCNSIEVINNNYEGVSQDEVAYLNEMKKYNFNLIKSKEESKIISLNGKEIFIETPMKLEFSSRRQRMSIVIKIYGKYFLLTKGSDQKLLTKEAKERILIDKNSEYRSLVLCFTELSKEELERYTKKYKVAISSSKTEDLEKVFSEIEQELIYIGATFIEDELQDNIKDTILSLREAGIRFWMITGDKKETALSCAINCCLLQKDFQRDNSGILLHSNEILKDDIIVRNILKYKSGVIYRASPDHKEKITKFFIRNKKIVLAIGDGNNDVLMLQTANIGVGIKGREGTQACLAADISVPDFQCLKRMILIHGRHNLINFAVITFNSFYKNIFFILIQFYYDLFNGFSNKPVYNHYFLNYFNIFFTSLIPLYISIFNKDHPEEYLLKNPKKYKETVKYMNTKMFMVKISYSVFKSSLVFWLSYGIFFLKDFTNSSGLVGGYKAMNNYFSFVVFFAVILRQINNITFFVWYAYLTIFISIFAYFFTIFFLQEIDPRQNRAALNLYSMPIFYVSLVGMMGLIYLIDYFYTIYKERFVIEKDN